MVWRENLNEERKVQFVVKDNEIGDRLAKRCRDLVLAILAKKGGIIDFLGCCVLIRRNRQTLQICNNHKSLV